MTALCGLSGDEWTRWCRDQGLPDYRARQMRRWIFSELAVSFEAMSDLPRSLRAELSAGVAVLPPHQTEVLSSRDQTRKFILRFADGARVECVLIPDDDRQTLCASSQVGCAMGCRFCASGLLGMERQLGPDEIVAQFLVAARELRQREPGASITNIVFMGLGEPLANYDAVLQAIRILHDPDSGSLGQRRFTISTVGVPGRIPRLAEEGLALTLAISLHAPNDELRRRIVPTAQRMSVDDLLADAGRYVERTGRRVTLEYVLLGGVNDAPAQARELARRVESLVCMVNLIPYNAVEGLPFRTSSPEDVRAFQDELRARGLNAQVRRRRGDDVDAACGQLRLRRTLEERQTCQS